MGCCTERALVHIAHVLQKLHFFQFFTGAAGCLALLLGPLHTLVRREPPPGVVPDVRRPGVKRDLQTGRSVQGTNGGRGSKGGTMQR